MGAVPEAAVELDVFAIASNGRQILDFVQAAGFTRGTGDEGRTGVALQEAPVEVRFVLPGPAGDRVAFGPKTRSP